MQAEVGKIKISWGKRKLTLTLDEAVELKAKLHEVIDAVRKLSGAEATLKVDAGRTSSK